MDRILTEAKPQTPTPEALRRHRDREDPLSTHYRTRDGSGSATYTTKITLPRGTLGSVGASDSPSPPFPTPGSRPLSPSNDPCTHTTRTRPGPRTASFHRLPASPARFAQPVPLCARLAPSALPRPVPLITLLIPGSNARLPSLLTASRPSSRRRVAAAPLFSLGPESVDSLPPFAPQPLYRAGPLFPPPPLPPLRRRRKKARPHRPRLTPAKTAVAPQLAT